MRRQHPESWEDERCSLLGNSFCVPGVAWLLANWLVKTGCLAAVPPVEELVQQGMSDPPRRPSPCEASLELCRRIMLLQTHRGGEVYGILGPSGKKFAFKAAIDSGYWQWRTVVRSRWKTKEHINVLEARAYVGSLRWRARRETSIGSRFVHLLDSTVTISAMAKGRSSSRRLQRPLRQASAVILATGFSPVLGFVRSHRNPADKPSRAGPPVKRAREK